MSDPSVLTGSAPLTGLAVYTLFRGDPRQLLQWANVHLTAAADHVYAVLDRPLPGLVASLPEHPRVSWLAIDEATWATLYAAGHDNVERKQVDAFRWVAARATADGHRFLAFIDADEIVMLREPLLDLVDAHPDAVAFRLDAREMWYAAEGATDDPFAASWALSRPRDWFDWSGPLGWRAQFLRRGAMGYDVGKCLYRLPLAVGQLSVHGPQSPALLPLTVDVPASSGGLLHFDAGSLSTWNTKWVSRLTGASAAHGLGAHRLAQQQLFALALRGDADEQAAFFRGFYSLDGEAERILSERGLLERVDVRGETSGPLPLPAQESAPADLARLPTPAGRVDFQFALVCDQRFVRPTLATMISVLSQVGDRGSVRFVVLGDGLTPADAALFRSLVHTRFDVDVRVHDVTSNLDRDVGTEDAKRATFGRIYLIDHLPEQRTVYLDGDVLATRDFTEIFSLDLEGACLAGVPDSAALRLLADPTRVPIEQRMRLLGITDGDPLDYLNGGVLVFDLDNPDFRALALEARRLVVTQGRALKQRDQDAMNLAFAGRKHRLPSTYNYMTQFYVSDRCVDGDLVSLKYAAADASLIHFSGAVKPWERVDDEFYNGLYRRLVLEAEDKVGLSSGLFFSRPEPRPRDGWTAQRWAEVFAAPHRRSLPPPRPVDLELVDVTVRGLYLRADHDLVDLARAGGLTLRVTAAGRVLAEAPLASLTAPVAHLFDGVGARVRLLPLDLSGAAGPSGLVHDVEIVVVAPGDHGLGELTRFVRGLPVLGLGAGPATLPELGVDGAVTELTGADLRGWFVGPSGVRRPEPLSLHVDGHLVAQALPDRGQSDDQGRTTFTFPVGALTHRGLAADASVTVRVSGANIPLRGGPLTVADLGRHLRWDEGRAGWVPVVERPSRRGLPWRRR